MSFVDAIGAVLTASGTVLTAISFFSGNWRGGGNEGATVTIKAGLERRDDASASLSGSIHRIYAYDERNVYAGQAGGGFLNSGDVLTRTVDQKVGGRRAGYISVANNDDATCISWITVTMFDGTRGGAWTGDIGPFCGQAFYYSVEPAGEKKDGTGEYVPRCTWIDANKSGTITSAALKFDVGAHAEKVVDTTIRNGVCRYTIFGPDRGPIPGQPGRRSDDDRPSWMTEQLIVSNRTSQPAEELCNSDLSWGPDFIGPDGKFCDMGSKTLMPLCSSEAVDGCVEVNEDEGNVVKRMSVAKRVTGVVHKSYKNVQKWGH
ncbi:hypothetical protein BDW02DRAFT_569351 [Decorospora gaudefroyi]|uniref:Uncharacterized protein n=1 Tax=Decorospora gaudefroyi TaxID=184978 RepID=A0A6A5KD16_9PLEO|nr:hypothetical protein BDW02DRAFT_569351 [Decorospora gaudefroyi]